MKRFIFLVAAMLLSVGTFAQSGNNGTPLKGDVNEDGVVNLADVTALVNLILNGGGGTAQTTTYYWYVGTTQPNSVDDNWRTSTNNAGFTETVNLTSGVTWFAYPSNWTYSAVDSSGDGFAFNAFVPAATKTSISGYTLLKMSLAGSENVTITFSLAN